MQSPPNPGWPTTSSIPTTLHHPEKWNPAPTRRDNRALPLSRPGPGKAAPHKRMSPASKLTGLMNDQGWRYTAYIRS
ncbi:hypothetical protein GCM10010207_86300 [Streptomyces atratus]|nr:hypothetical protein GCM10010207_86300 [Streptomyces atratus]